MHLDRARAAPAARRLSDGGRPELEGGRAWATSTATARATSCGATASTGANTIWKSGNSATVQAVATDGGPELAGGAGGGLRRRRQERHPVAQQQHRSEHASGRLGQRRPCQGYGWRTRTGRSPMPEAATGAGTRGQRLRRRRQERHPVAQHRHAAPTAIWKSGNSATCQAVASDGRPELAGGGGGGLRWRRQGRHPVEEHEQREPTAIWKSGNSATGRRSTTLARPELEGGGRGRLRRRRQGRHPVAEHAPPEPTAIWKSGNSATVQAVTTLGGPELAGGGGGRLRRRRQGRHPVAEQRARGANSIWKSGNSGNGQAVDDGGRPELEDRGRRRLRRRRQGRHPVEEQRRREPTASGRAATAPPCRRSPAKATRTGRWWARGTTTATARPTSCGGTRSTGANTIWKSASSGNGQAVSTLADQNWSMHRRTGERRPAQWWRRSQHPDRHDQGRRALWRSGQRHA